MDHHCRPDLPLDILKFIFHGEKKKLHRDVLFDPAPIGALLKLW
jgi:hypothetical protein